MNPRFAGNPPEGVILENILEKPLELGSVIVSHFTVLCIYRYMQAIPLKRVVAHKHHLMELQPYAGNAYIADPYAVVSSRAPVAPLFSEHDKNAAQQELQVTSVMKALEDDHKSKLMTIINSSKIAQMPTCMERCTPFKGTSPHCVWCPAAEGSKSEDGN